MPNRPNVLFLMADQLRADALGCSGNPVIRLAFMSETAQATESAGDAP